MHRLSAAIGKSSYNVNIDDNLRGFFLDSVHQCDVICSTLAPIHCEDRVTHT